MHTLLTYLATWLARSGRASAALLFLAGCGAAEPRPADMVEPVADESPRVQPAVPAQPARSEPEPLRGCMAHVDATAARAAFGTARDDLRDCYESALRTDPSLRVSVRLRLRLGMSGDVIRASISEDLPPALKVCLIEVGAALSMPPLTRGRGPGDCGVVVAPINFTPREPPQTGSRSDKHGRRVR